MLVELQLRHLLTIEEAMRGMAVTFARGRNRPMSWGKSLFEAARLQSHVWQDNKNLLRTYAKPQSGQQSSGYVQAWPQSSGKAKGKAAQGVVLGNVTILPQDAPGIQVNKPAQPHAKG